MKVRNWICDCPEGKIHLGTEKICKFCNTLKGKSHTIWKPKIEISKPKTKKESKREMIENGEIYYNLQLEMNHDMHTIALELGKEYIEIWTAVREYKKSKNKI